MSKDPSTRLIHTPEVSARRTVNPAIERGSTLLFDSERDLYGIKPGYGRRGLSVQAELANALADLEGAEHVFLTPSGLTACAAAIASVSKSGGHILYCDTVYGPTRRFCERRLPMMGVAADCFSPEAGATIETLIQPETTAIILESPGSLTFEIPDTPAIVEVAKHHGVLTVLDNTWSAGVFYKPLAFGVDISVQSLTKYVIGHADAFGGAIACRTAETAARVDACLEDWGLSQSVDDAYLALRGLRTLAGRLAQHQEAALKVATWLQEQSYVACVLHPALDADKQHAVWRRDFTGASGLFGVVLKEDMRDALDDAISHLELFSLGFSWGGFESLLIPCDRQLKRMHSDWTTSERGPLLRIHIGLEAADDLIADLDQAFGSVI